MASPSAPSVPASDYLDLVMATPVDADPQIWGVIAGSLDSLDSYYRGDAGGAGAVLRFPRAP